MLAAAVHQPSQIAERPLYEFLATGVLGFIRRGIQSYEILRLYGCFRPCLRWFGQQLRLELFLATAQCFLIGYEIPQGMATHIRCHPLRRAAAVIEIDGIVVHGNPPTGI